MERSAAESMYEALSSWVFAELQDSRLSQGCSSEDCRPLFGRFGCGLVVDLVVEDLVVEGT